MTDQLNIDDPCVLARSGWIPAAASERRVALRTGEIHIWTVDLQSPVCDSFREVLSPAELGTAEQYRFAKDQDAFLARRVARRKILSSYLGQSPSELIFEHNEWGKPRLSSWKGCSEIEFNTSSSRDLMVIAVSHKITLGVDIEFNDPRIDFLSVADYLFTAAELPALYRLNRTFQSVAFYTLWTQKEAYGKAVGHGLLRDRKQNLPDSQSAHHESDDCVSAFSRTAGNWWFQPLEIGTSAYVAMLCSSAEKCRLRYFTG